jgi:hypothetical protein
MEMAIEWPQDKGVQVTASWGFQLNNAYIVRVHLSK